MKAIIGNQEHYSEDVKRVLTEELAKSEENKAVIIILLKKDGTQRIHKSLCTFEEVCFLKCFFDTWIFKWFYADMITKEGN